MNSTVYFVAGQIMMAVGAYVLAKQYGQLPGIGLWLLAQGIVACVFGASVQGQETAKKPWHE